MSTGVPGSPSGMAAAAARRRRLRRVLRARAVAPVPRAGRRRPVVGASRLTGLPWCSVVDRRAPRLLAGTSPRWRCRPGLMKRLRHCPPTRPGAGYSAAARWPGWACLRSRWSSPDCPRPGRLRTGHRAGPPPLDRPAPRAGLDARHPARLRPRCVPARRRRADQRRPLPHQQSVAARKESVHVTAR